MPSVGSVSVRVVPDAQDFVSSIRRQIEQETKGLGNDISKNLTRRAAQGLVDDVEDAFKDIGKTSDKEGVRAGREFGESFAKQFRGQLKNILSDFADGQNVNVGADVDDAAVDRLRAKLAALRGDRVDFVIDADVNTRYASAKLDELERKVRAIGDIDASPNIEINDFAARIQLRYLENLLDRVDSRRVTIDVDFDDLDARAQMGFLLGQMNDLARQRPSIHFDVDDLDARLKIAFLKGLITQVGAMRPTITFDIDDFVVRMRMIMLQATARNLAAETYTLQFGVDDTGVIAHLASLRTMAENLDGLTFTIKVDVDDAAALAALANIKAATRMIPDSVIIKMQADVATAMAKISALENQANRVGGTKQDIEFDTRNGPNIIPILGGILALVAAIGAAAPAAAAGVAAIGVGVGSLGQGLAAGIAGFSGITDAIKAVNSENDNVAKGSASAARSQVSNANAVANAQSSLAAAVTNANRQQITGAESVRDAQTAVTAAIRNSDRSAIQSAERVASSRRAVGDAIASSAERVANAERALTRAQESSQLAQEDLTRARRDAREAIEDLQLQLSGAALSEERARLNLAKSQKKLVEGMLDPKSTDLDKWDFQLDVREAVQNLAEVRERQGDLRQEQDDYNRSGVEGSRGVVSAQRAVQNSLESVGEAQRGLTASQTEGQRQVQDAVTALASAQRAASWDAMDSADSVRQAQESVGRAARAAAWQQEDSARAVENAQRALAAATVAGAAASTASADKARLALEKLSPAGREFVRFWTDEMQPAFAGLGHEVAEVMLPEIQNGLRRVIGMAPLFKATFTEAGRVIGDTFRNMAWYISGPGFANVTNIMATNNRVFKTFGGIAQSALASLLILLDAAGPMMEKLADDILDGARWFEEFLNAAQRSGDLDRWFAQMGGEFESIVGKLWRAGEGVVRFVLSLAPLGDALLTVVALLGDFLGWISQFPALTNFFAALFIGTALLVAFGNAIQRVVLAVTGRSMAGGIRGLYQSMLYLGGAAGRTGTYFKDAATQAGSYSAATRNAAKATQAATAAQQNYAKAQARAQFLKGQGIPTATPTPPPTPAGPNVIIPPSGARAWYQQGAAAGGAFAQGVRNAFAPMPGFVAGAARAAGQAAHHAFQAAASAANAVPDAAQVGFIRATLAAQAFEQRVSSSVNNGFARAATAMSGFQTRAQSVFDRLARLPMEASIGVSRYFENFSRNLDILRNGQVGTPSGRTLDLSSTSAMAQADPAIRGVDTLGRRIDSASDSVQRFAIRGQLAMQAFGDRTARVVSRVSDLAGALGKARDSGPLADDIDQQLAARDAVRAAKEQVGGKMAPYDKGVLGKYLNIGKDDDGSTAINRLLRTGEGNDETRAQTKALAKLVDKFSLSAPAELYRGVQGDYLPKGNLVGKQLTELGFASTTFSKNIGKLNDAVTDTVFRLNAPAGTKGMAVGANGGNNFEREVLLPPGSRFNVTADEVSNFNGRTVRLITADVQAPRVGGAISLGANEAVQAAGRVRQALDGVSDRFAAARSASASFATDGAAHMRQLGTNTLRYFDDFRREVGTYRDSNGKLRQENGKFLSESTYAQNQLKAVTGNTAKAMQVAYNRATIEMGAGLQAVADGAQRVVKNAPAVGRELGNSLLTGAVVGINGTLTGLQRVEEGVRRAAAAAPGLGTSLRTALETGVVRASLAGNAALDTIGAKLRSVGTTAVTSAAAGFNSLRTALETGVVRASLAGNDALDRVNKSITNAGTFAQTFAQGSARFLGDSFVGLSRAATGAASVIGQGFTSAMLGSKVSIDGVIQRTGGLIGALGGPWGIAITGATVLIGLLADNHAKAAQKAQEQQAKLESLKGTLDQVSGATTQATIDMKAQENVTSGLDKKAMSFGISSSDLARAQLGMGDALGRVNNQLVGQAERFLTTNPLYAQAMDAAKTYGLDLGTLTGAMLGNNEAIASVETALGVASQSGDNASQSLAALLTQVLQANPAMRDLGQSIGSSNAELNRATDAFLRAKAGGDGFRTAVEDVRGSLSALKTSAIGANGEIIGTGASVDLLNGQLGGVSGSARDAARAAGELAERTGAVGGAAVAARDSMQGSRDAFIKSAREMGLTAEQADGLANRMGLIPSVITTQFNQLGVAAADDALAALQGRIKAVDNTTGAITLNGASTVEETRKLETLGFIVRTLPNGVVQVFANITPANTVIDGVVARTNLLTGTMGLKADPLPANATTDQVIERINLARGTLGILGDNLPAQASTQERLDWITRQVGVLGIGGDPARPGGANDSVDRKVREIFGTRADLNVGADTRRLDQDLTNFFRENVYNVRPLAPPGTPERQAQDSGLFNYARGGFALPMASGGIIPAGLGQIVPPNTPTLVGDRKRDDEAYIPINGAARSVAILTATAARMGFSLTPMANGGIIGMASGGVTGPTAGAAATASVPAADAAGQQAAATAAAALTGALQDQAGAASTLTPLLASVSAQTGVVTTTAQGLAVATSTQLTPSVQSLMYAGLTPLVTQLLGTVFPTLGQYQLQTGTYSVLANQALQNAQLQTQLSTQATATNTALNSTAMTNAVAGFSTGAQSQLYNLRAAEGIYVQATDLMRTLHEGDNELMLGSTFRMVSLSQGALESLQRVQGATSQNASLMADGVDIQYGRASGAAGNHIRWMYQFPLTSLVRAYDKLNGDYALGLPGGMLPPLGYATGGSVPGTGNRDTVPAMLTPGEFVLSKPAVKAAGGLDAVSAMHASLRGDSAQYLNRGGPVGVVQHFAAGGPVQQLWPQLFSIVRGAFPSATNNSNFRPGDPGWHGRGKAVDLGGPMMAINQWLAQRFPNSTELIHTPGVNLWHGAPHTYNAETRAGHYDHVHWAMADASMLDGKTPTPGWAGGGAGGTPFDPTALVNDAFGQTYRELDDLGKQAPAAAVPAGSGRKLADAAKQKIVDSMQTMFMSGGFMGATSAEAPAIVKIISDVARMLGLGREGAIIGVATGLVESELRNLGGGDRDSVGVFQQRPSQGWGSIAQIMNVTYAASKFFSRFPGNWRSMPPGDLAQSVQRSAFPGKYATRMAEATGLVTQFGGFDKGGEASGLGYMPKFTPKPERVLSPQQTQAFNTLVSQIDDGDLLKAGSYNEGGSRTFNVYPRENQSEMSIATAVRRIDSFENRIR